MSRSLASASLALLISALSGCCFGMGTPTPEEVCLHLEEVLLQSQLATYDAAFVASRSVCVAGLTRMQTEAPADYSTSANCITAIPPTAGSLLSGCEERVLPYLPGGLVPRAPVPAAPVEALVTDMHTDPRCVEPCIVECGGASNAGCWEYCLGRRMEMVNARVRTQQGQ